jgi:hypothetical protein
MRMPHEPNAVANLREPTPEDPWRVLLRCGVDGTDYGFGGVMSPYALMGKPPVVHQVED